MQKSKIRKTINPYYKPGNVFERDEQYYQQNLVYPSKESQKQKSEMLELKEQNVMLRQSYQDLVYPMQKLAKYRHTQQSKCLMSQQEKIKQLTENFQKNTYKIKKLEKNRIHMEESLQRITEIDKQIFYDLGQPQKIKINRGLKVAKEAILKGQRKQTIYVLLNKILQ